MKRYKLITESFTTVKPKPEPNYTLKKVKKKIDGKVVIGWEKKLKKGKVSKKSGFTKQQRKMRAKKATKTKSRDVIGKKKAVKRAKITRKLNKR